MDQDADPRYKLTVGLGQPLPEAISELVQKLVDDGTFKAGGRLPNESELARQMGVARSSVRTALQRLEVLRVLEVKRGLGWYVRRVPPVPAADTGPFDGRHYEMADLFELRIGLEGLAASLAAARATEGDVTDIAKNNADHKAAGEARDQDELLLSDMAFHDAIVRASRNELLIETYSRIVGELTEWRYQSYLDPKVCRRSWREHEKIVRFLRNNDPGGARVAMNGHLQHLYDELPEIREEPLDSTESVTEELEWHNR